MTLRTPALVGATAAFIVVMLVAGWLAWRKVGHDDAAANFSALAVCLAGGPERVAPEDASRRARRLHHEPDDPTLLLCTPYRDALAKSRYAQRELPMLASAAESLNLAPSVRRRRWDLEYLFRAGELLPWRPPANLDGASIRKSPEVLVDSVLAAARDGASSFRSKDLDINHDRYPPDRLVISKDGEADIVIADAPGRPLSKVERAPAAKRQGSPPEIAAAGKEPVIAFDDVAIWISDKRLHMFRVRDQVDSVVDLPGKSWTASLRSCRARNERVVAVEIYEAYTILVFALRNDVLENRGQINTLAKVDRAGSHGSWSLGCDDGTARIAWAISEPASLPDESKPFPTDGHQRIFVATCTKSECKTNETRIALNVGWTMIGGFGGPWKMSTPRVYALGKRVLLAWVGEGAMFYRLAPFEALDSTANGWIAEVARPGRGLEGDPNFDSFFFRWPREAIFLRGGVALVSLTEEVDDKDAASVLVRFDDEGHAEALPVPTK
jgi:hypothetical protein